MSHLLLKLAALFSYCGGPLFIAEILKKRYGPGPAAFIVTFPPVGLMVLGSLLLDDFSGDRWPSLAVRAGRQALYVVLLMHAYALWRFAEGVRVAEQGLYYFGIAVGAVWSVAYLRAYGRWVRSTESSRAVDPASTEPIEPT